MDSSGGVEFIANVQFILVILRLDTYFPRILFPRTFSTYQVTIAWDVLHTMSRTKTFFSQAPRLLDGKNRQSLASLVVTNMVKLSISVVLTMDVAKLGHYFCWSRVSIVRLHFDLLESVWGCTRAVGGWLYFCICKCCLQMFLRVASSAAEGGPLNNRNGICWMRFDVQ